MRLDICSHHVKVSELGGAMGKEALLRFCAPLIRYKLVKSRGRFHKEMDKVFAAATKDRTEFRFHVNQLEDLLLHLRNYGFEPDQLLMVRHGYKRDDFPVVEHRVKKMFDPRANQVPVIDYVIDDGFPQKIVTLPPGAGKACWNETLVKVPSGWRRMRLIREGDYVIARNGKPTRVTGVYPQGKVQLYKVTFRDGRSVEVCGEHLWKSFYKERKDKWDVRDTHELKRILGFKNARVYIPLNEPELSEDVPLPIDPYLLGVLIGDGSISTNSISFDTPDEFILEEVRRIVEPKLQVKFRSGYSYGISSIKRGTESSTLVKPLANLGLLGTRSYEKFVPFIYKQGSPKQKLALLQGLLDTDGTVGRSGDITFDTSSEQLAKDVQELAWSLGCIARKTERESFFTYKGERKKGLISHRVYIRAKSPGSLFRLPRKRDRAGMKNQYSDNLKLEIVSIEESRIDHATCISVEDPEKLYVIENYVVTHNTFVAMRCMWLLKVRGIYTFKGGYTDRWVEAFNETFDYEKGDLVVVRGSAALVKLMRNAMAGEPIPKVLIMSFGTWRDYLKDYEASNGKSKIYPISPDEFFVKLGIGYRVIDEVHQEFHLNFKIDLYTHVYKSLSLSGTMESSDAFMNRMYCIPYPVQRRNDGGGAKPHIAVKALFYKLSLPKIIRYKGAQGGYSHNAFEESLMSKKGIFPNYLKLIHKVVECYYGSVREDGQKMLIFCASVSLCTIVRDYLQKMYPTLTVTRYCQGDEYQDLLDADIGVSTVLSAGTAVDIPNLRVTLMTTSIDSRQSNEQALGRTRPLKDWLDVIPLFLYLVCEDIDRHVIYHENKMNFFKGKVLSHEEEELDFVV